MTSKHSPFEFAKSVYKILKDETIHKKFKNNCAQTLTNFNMSSVTKRIEAVYESSFA